MIHLRRAVGEDLEPMGICRRAGFEEFSTGMSFAMRSCDAACG